MSAIRCAAVDGPTSRHGLGERRLEGVAGDGDEQVGLAGDVPVDRRDGDAGRGGDRLRGGGVEALGGEQLGGRAHDAGAGVLAASSAQVGGRRKHLGGATRAACTSAP